MLRCQCTNQPNFASRELEKPVLKLYGFSGLKLLLEMSADSDDLQRLLNFPPPIECDTIRALAFRNTCTSMSKRTLATRTLTEYKCKSTQPGGCSRSLALSLSVQMSRPENNEKKHHRDKELVSRLCVTFYWNRRARRSTVQKK